MPSCTWEWGSNNATCYEQAGDYKQNFLKHIKSLELCGTRYIGILFVIEHLMPHGNMRFTCKL